MHAVSSYALNELHLIVEYQGGSIAVAKLSGFDARCNYVLFGCLFHPELYPLAAAFQGQLYALKVAYAAVVVRYELYHCLAGFACLPVYLFAVLAVFAGIIRRRRP